MKVEKTEYYCDVCGAQMFEPFTSLSKIRVLVSLPGEQRDLFILHICNECGRKIQINFDTFQEALIMGLKEKRGRA